MNSTRGAYKAKLREVSSTANRRRSRGVERKNFRNDELCKRRNLSDDMSPVVEKPESGSVSKRKIHQRGPSKAKMDTVLDRLNQWRASKKREHEQEKANAKSKPTFKVGALVRDSEAQLFKGAVCNKSKAGKPKEAEKRAPPPKKQPAKAKEPALPKTRARTAPVTALKSNNDPANVSVNKKQPVKAKEPATRASTRSRPGDLATKLTAAAAAKRNAIASPKKFLRASRATTLQKKESVNSKIVNKSLKASLRSTGDLFTKTADLGPKNFKSSSKSTGNLLARDCFLYNAEMFPEEELAPVNTEENLLVSPAGNPSIIPKKVPKILTDFNFSAMASSSESTGDSVNESSNNFEGFTFAGLNLKPKRKSTRKSTRLASNVEFVDKANDLVANTNDNLMTFTPGLTKRSNVRKSKGLHSLIQPVVETMITDEMEEASAFNVSKTPKSAKRRGVRKSIHTEFDVLQTLPTAEDDVCTLVTPKSGRRKSVRKSIHFFPSDVVQNLSDCKTRVTRKSMRKSTNLAASPKPDKRKNSRTPDPVGSPKKSQNTNAGEIRNLLKSTPGHSNPRRKSVRKSFSLQAALALVQLDSDNILDSVPEPSQEIALSMDLADRIDSDYDTQTPFVDGVSSPKVPKSSQKKRQSLTASMVISSIEGISAGEIPASSPIKLQKDSHTKRNSLSRQSRKLRSTPVSSRRSTPRDMDLDISNVSTPNSVRNIENIPRRRSTVISVSDEGTAVGRELEPALAYKVETVRRSARASRILNELVIEKIDGEKSFFEISLDESMKGNNSINVTRSNCNTPLALNQTPHSSTTSPFTPRKSNEVTTSSGNSSSNPPTTPTSGVRGRHSMALSSSFKQPGLPLSALRQPGSQRRRTCCTPKSKTPEHMIDILKKSPMIELSRRKSRHLSSPGAAPKGQYFRDLISNETERLRNLSQSWNNVAATEIELQEEVLGQIRSTVGKALLLIEQRFKQFSGLVDNYVFGLGEKETTPTDLQGFWDMIYFQVEDVNNQFKELEELQQSGWQLKSSTPKAAKLQLKKKTKGKPKVKGVKSNFAAFRAELQKKKAAQATSTLPTNDMFVV